MLSIVSGDTHRADQRADTDVPIRIDGNLRQVSLCIATHTVARLPSYVIGGSRVVSSGPMGLVSVTRLPLRLPVVFAVVPVI